MQIREERADRGIPIEGYGDGGFRVKDARHQGSIIIGPRRAIPWAAEALADAEISHFDDLSRDADDIDLLLIGAGETMQPPPAALRAHFRALGMTVEVMSTGAAARTYNVLLAEGRRIAAALIAVD